ncbi:UNVERIFIED_CONTAM: hypothetical protein HDU68_001958 [Siphonaria sp. JEL0065]|nr:hypothetical protein HDU68_001958 [Siphonaria sp. JEL0065]
MPSLPDLGRRPHSLASPTDSIKTRQTIATLDTPSWDQFDEGEVFDELDSDDASSFFSFEAECEDVLHSDVCGFAEFEPIEDDQVPFIPVRTESLNSIREPLSLHTSKRLRRLAAVLSVASHLDESIPPYQPEDIFNIQSDDALLTQSLDTPKTVWKRPSRAELVLSSELIEDNAPETEKPQCETQFGGLSLMPLDLSTLEPPNRRSEEVSVYPLLFDANSCTSSPRCTICDEDREDEFDLVRRINDISCSKLSVKDRPLIQVVTIINMMTPLMEKYPDLVAGFEIDSGESDQNQ